MLSIVKKIVGFKNITIKYDSLFTLSKWFFDEVSFDIKICI